MESASLPKASLGICPPLPATTWPWAGQRQMREHQTFDGQALVLGAKREPSPCESFEAYLKHKII